MTMPQTHSCEPRASKPRRRLQGLLAALAAGGALAGALALAPTASAQPQPTTASTTDDIHAQKTSPWRFVVENDTGHGMAVSVVRTSAPKTFAAQPTGALPSLRSHLWAMNWDKPTATVQYSAGNPGDANYAVYNIDMSYGKNGRGATCEATVGHGRCDVVDLIDGTKIFLS